MSAAPVEVSRRLVVLREGLARAGAVSPSASRQWARNIVARHGRGEPVSLAALRNARQALGLEGRP